MAQPQQQQQQHILVACYPSQGHINPNLRLAKLLARQTGARITFSTAVTAHRRMFPNHQPPTLPGDLFSYIPYSNGFDDGFDPQKHGSIDYFSHTKQHGSQTLAAIIDDLALAGHPVTCIIYSFFMPWVADVALDRSIPSFLHWIQPATAFAVYWFYFHDYESILTSKLYDPLNVVNLPKLPPMRICDLPSFFTAYHSPDDPYGAILPRIGDMFEALDKEIAIRGSKPRVIANTAVEMEAPAFESVADKVSMVGIGPLLEDAGEGSLFKLDDGDGYMDWLDAQGERSVVYVSFGSISVLKKEQVEEIWRGLRESGRPYLWVVRKDSRWEGLKLDGDEDGGRKGMVVEWCSQGRVLNHRAVGCFVTHCGWNSTVESLLSGVPTVAMPQWSDQLTNAWLMEEMWGVGVRVGVNGEGLVEAEELRRCVEMVMGEGERGEEIRRKVEIWKERAGQATVEGGSSCANLKAFVGEIAGDR